MDPIEKLLLFSFFAADSTHVRNGSNAKKGLRVALRHALSHLHAPVASLTLLPSPDVCRRSEVAASGDDAPS